jgi:hypothetical protein
MNYKKLFLLFSTFSFIIIINSQDNFISDSKDIFPYELNQTNQKNRAFSLDKFSFGVYGGINFSQIIPLTRYSIFNSSNNSNLEKDYELFFKNIGFQTGFIINYKLNNIITISLEPVNIDYTYKYKNTYQWTGHTNLLFESDFTHRLSFFEIPLIVGFHTTFKKWQPYYLAGVYYGFLKNANTDISVNESSTSLSGSNQVMNYSTNVNSTNQYTSNQFGALGGIGISYAAGGLKINLDARVRLLFTNLNTDESRFQNNMIVSGAYDVPDKFKLTNLSVNLGITVPLLCKNQSGRGGAVFCE